MQLTLKKLSDKLHTTIFWVKRLKIIYFYSNGFLNTLARSVQVKIKVILRFIQPRFIRPFITGFNVYKYGNRIQKECAFQIPNKVHFVFPHVDLKFTLLPSA